MKRPAVPAGAGDAGGDGITGTYTLEYRGSHASQFRYRSSYKKGYRVRSLHTW